MQPLNATEEKFKITWWKLEPVLSAGAGPHGHTLSVFIESLAVLAVAPLDTLLPAVRPGGDVRARPRAAVAAGPELLARRALHPALTDIVAPLEPDTLAGALLRVRADYRTQTFGQARLAGTHVVQTVHVEDLRVHVPVAS